MMGTSLVTAIKKWCVICLMMVTSCFVAVDTVTFHGFDFRKEFSSNRDETATHYTGYDVPVLKMLLRDIRDFRSGKQATVTLIFRSSQPVAVRWFRLGKPLRFPTAEINNMLPVEDDPEYAVSFLRSGDVIATFLTLLNFNGEFPQDFETVITTEDASLQYQISTTVRKQTPLEGLRENIDGFELTQIPVPHFRFRRDTNVELQCELTVPHDNHSFRQLMLLEVSPKIGGGTVSMEHRRMAVINDQTHEGKIAEQNNNRIMSGLRRQITPGYVSYQLGITFRNATRATQGIYQFNFEKGREKLHINAVLSLRTIEYPFTVTKAYYIPCDKQEFKNTTMVLRDRISCIRCRGIGYPRPAVALYKKSGKEWDEVMDYGDVWVNKYVNVVDGAVSEALYTFRRPDQSLNGRYQCKAKNHATRDSPTFRLTYRPDAKT